MSVAACVWLCALSSFLQVISARVIWVPEQFDPNEKSTLLARDSTCGGVAGLIQCGASFPGDFCCSRSTTCLALNTSSSTVATICCPAGQDCSTINPISCDLTLQNATTSPNSQLHASPPTPLESCGNQCCPMGYSCQNDQCIAQPSSTASAEASSSASSSAPVSSTAASSGSPSSTVSLTSSGMTVAPTAESSGPVHDMQSSSGQSFSGSSFAAGFIPGIALGAIIAACVLLFFLCRRSRRPSSNVDEKEANRDTLTDLGTLSRRPTMHGRSISEPTADPSYGYRTDFLRGTPLRTVDGPVPEMGNSVEVHGPVTPARTPKAVKALFSRSPFLIQTPSTPPSTQPPMPAHLKRGTLSFTISPPRQLKKQKSMHSLRRQMTEIGASRSSSRRTAKISNLSRSASTETIRVLIDTPDQRPPYTSEVPQAAKASNMHQPPDSASTWQTTDSFESRPGNAADRALYATSSRYPTAASTPTRPPFRRSEVPAESALGTPYSPSRFYGSGKGKATGVLIADDGLRVVREPEKRDTTFSAMMERAGLRKSDLLIGTGSRY